MLLQIHEDNPIKKMQKIWTEALPKKDINDQ